MRLPLALATLAVVLACPAASRASDHTDGLTTTIDPAGDITDVFAFTSPRDPSKLVLIMNVDPFGGARARFSDAVDYKFRIRPIDDAKTLVPGAAASEESIVCTFAGGSIFEAKQDATCQFNLKKKTDAVKFATRGGSFKAGGSGTKDGIRVFAGVRSDPWFLNLKRTIMYSTGMQVPKTAESNSLQGGNVLSIVIEVPKDQLSGPLLAVTAQTVGRKSP